MERRKRKEKDPYKTHEKHVVNNAIALHPLADAQPIPQHQSTLLGQHPPVD